MQWETGQAHILKQEATHCTFDNQTCYQAQSVPVIFGTSSNSGYTTGGQNLTVSGYGFDYGEIIATVDGQPCTVTQQSSTAFSCEIQPKSEVSVQNSSYVGSHGLRRHFINGTEANNNNWLNWWELTKNRYNFTEHLALTLGARRNEGDKIGNIFKGWFIAPATTRYRFYIACNDYCNINLGNTSGVVEEPIKLVETRYYTDYRDFWETRNSEYQKISDWVTLNEGEHYFLDSYHLEGGGTDYFSTAVEIEQTEIVGHHHSMKEV